MDTIGKLVNVTRDIMTRKLNVTFQIDTEPIDDLNSLAKLDVIYILAEKHRKVRSRSANAYFHCLCGKIADKVGMSKIRCKHELICRYGQQDFIDGEQVIIKTNLGVDKMLEQESLHVLPCGCKVENGAEVVFYKVYRKSRTYNSKEMSILIDGTIQEAKDLGIETLPPHELQRLIKKWKPEGV